MKDVHVKVKNGNNGHHRQRSEAEVRASLERSNQELKDALARLERGAKAKMDIGRRIAGKATTVLALGFLVGMLLGVVTAGPAARRRWRLPGRARQ